MRSESTRFFGQPRLTKAKVREVMNSSDHPWKHMKTPSRFFYGEAAHVPQGFRKIGGKKLAIVRLRPSVELCHCLDPTLKERLANSQICYDVDDGPAESRDPGASFFTD